jgi:hypothetical protein
VKKRHRLHWIMLLGLLFFSFASVTFAAPAPMTEQQKIDALIHSVEVLPGAQFIRNGSSYDGKAAAEHLRYKRNYAGDLIKTASDFITCCASKSSMSGQAYQIRFANGKTENAEVYFRDELKRIETPPPPVIAAPIPAPIAAPIPVPVTVPTIVTVPAPAMASPPTQHSAATTHRKPPHHAKTADQKRPS